MLTSLQIATLDSWNSELASPITVAAANDPDGLWLVFLVTCYFLALVAMGGLVLMNLVTAIIVEQSIEGAKQDLEAMAAWERRKIKQLTKALENAFQSADIDNDGELSWPELESAYKDKDSIMHPFLTKLGDLEDIREMFVMMDVDGSGCLETKEFTEGIQRCKDDFNKFMLWQLWKKQNSLMQRFDDMMAQSPTTSTAKKLRKLQHTNDDENRNAVNSDHVEISIAPDVPEDFEL